MNPEQLPLRDIHLPPSPGWWPPAPGWWVLAALLLAGLVLAAWLWWRQRRAVPARAARQIDRIEREWRERRDPRALLVGLATTLRRSAIALAGRERTAGLVGARWRDHLNAPLDDRPFDTTPGALLLDAAYRPDIPSLDDGDAEALVALCRGWLRAAARRDGP